MHPSRLDQRFFASSRGQIVLLLRRARSTVDELAGRLGLTDNAVRAHLSTLERDGLVEQRGSRRGEGKPAFLYELTPAAEQLFPKAYGLVLDDLLDLLQEHLQPEVLERVLRETGTRLGRGYRQHTGAPRARAQAAVEALNALGGLAELRAGSDGLVIDGYRCPLAALLPRHAGACRLAESLVSEATGLDVTERCERDAAHLACHFELR